MMMLAQQHFTRSNLYNQQPQPQQQTHLEVDPVDSDSITSSPHSTQSSFLSQYSNNLADTFDSVPSAVSRGPRNDIKTTSFRFPASPSQQPFDQSLSQVPDLMPSEPWTLQQHGQQQIPRTALRLGHHREPSLTSSLGSTGPASPYNANTSNPQIAVTDSSSDGFHDMGAGDNNYSYQMGKALPMTEQYTSLQNFAGHGIATADTLFAHGLPNVPAQQQPRHKPKVDRITDLLPAPELSTGSGTRSQPGSVASSVVGGDSPATPSFHEPEEDGRRRKNVFNTNQHPPKLDRTMTDIYSDDLYSPNFTITSASPPPQAQMAISPSSDLFAQRLQAANSQHLSAAQSPVSATSRHQSPFRHGSPLAPSMNDFSQASQVRMNSAQQVRERQKAAQDARALQQQLAHSGHQQQGTPSTISPKDALLEFNEGSDDSNNFPLFPQQEAHNFSLPQQTQAYQSATTPIQSNFNFNMPANIQIPQRYPFIAQPQQQATPATSHFSRISSAETDGSDVYVQRPARTAADGGTYTCTYHGCTLRFDTPALLQKHKREGHRQANALNSRPASMPSPGVPGSFMGSQAGPHRCDRINPSTGKPCNTVFSRPYDLTRHEDTIHNARKQKVRCNLCTEEKTFSRADALTRHYRVCHPDVEFPGKHRRRGGSH